jgi:tetratricopeptide (TPR) repeat protein
MPAIGGKASGVKKDTFRAQAAELGVGTLIHGSYYRRGDTLGFQAYLFDAQRGAIEAGVPVVEGAALEPMRVIGQIAQRVSGAVAAKLDLKLDLSLVPPPTFDAYRLFVDGNREMVRNNFGGALDLFLRAGASDTTFHTALYFAAAQAMNVNRWPLVDSLVRVLMRSATRVPQYDRIQLSYFQARLRGDEDDALPIVRELARLAPGTHMEFMVGYHALRNNRPREAAQVASRMDPERGFLRGWFWYWPILTGSYHLTGEHSQELHAARAAVDRYPELFALTRALEIRALAADPAMTDIVRWLDSVPSSAGQQEFARGYLLEIAGSELIAHGRRPAGMVVYNQAVNSYERAQRARPDDEELAFNLVRSLFALGRHDEALRRATELRARFPANVNYLGVIGTIQAARGRKVEAQAIARRLEGWNEPYLFGRPSYWLAAIAGYSGDLERGLEALTRAFSQGTPLWGYPNTPDFGDTHADVFLEPLREHPQFARLVRLRG